MASAEEPSPAGHEPVGKLIPAERRARIAALIGSRRSLRISWLAEQLGVSEMTVRRDLERLQLAGLLSRTHGGAILKRRLVEEPLYVENVAAHAEEKRRITRAAAAMIQPGETVFLGSGTTTVEVLRSIDPDLHATVVTHNAGALEVMDALSIELFLLGGSYRIQSNATEGAAPAELVSGFYASKMFLGADCLSLEEGVTTPSMGLAEVERAMVRHAKGEVIVLVDSSKIGIVADIAICPIERIDVVIVDDGIEDEVRSELEELGVRVVVA